MNRIVIFAFACMTLVACSQIIDEPFHFEKGQQMTLTVNSDIGTKVTSSLNANNIEFKWDKNDSIRVTVNGIPALFTLVSGSGKSSATFTGTMPASGDTFEVQYPYEERDITHQYCYGVDSDLHFLPIIDKGTIYEKCAMFFKKENCTSDHILLEPQYAGLKFQFRTSSSSEWTLQEMNVNYSVNSAEKNILLGMKYYEYNDGDVIFPIIIFPIEHEKEDIIVLSVFKQVPFLS